MAPWMWRLGAMLRRKRLAAETEEELRFHLEQEVEAGLRQGLTPEEARRRARLRAGAVAEAMEATRDEQGFRWLDGAALDLRHAARALRRDRGFGAVAVLVLSASVAITTLVFCLLEGVVLRPLPYRDPEQLVRLFDDDGANQPRFPVSIGHFQDLQRHARSLAGVALYTGRDVELTAAEGASRRLTGVAITDNFFGVLGRAPPLGREFTAAELRGDARVAIISHRLWLDRWRGDPDILGKTVRLDRQPWTIVGVAPEGFQHVGGAYRSPLQGETVEVWLPLALDIPERGQRAWHYCNAIARVAPGFQAAQVREELRRVAADASALYPKYGTWSMRMAPLRDEVTGGSRQLVWLLMAAGGLVSLLACANVAGLSVARAVSRRRELALRLALGADRWQLARVGLAENLLLGVAGAALGLALAAAAVPVLRHLLPADFPRAHEVAMSGLAGGVAAALALGTAVLAGLVPWGGRAVLGDTRLTPDRDSRRLRAALVVGELAFAGLLCAGSLYLLRSYDQVGARDHGFVAEGVLTFELTLPSVDDKVLPAVQDEILTRIAAVPGVASVGATTGLPWSGYDENTGFGIIGRPTDEEHGPEARFASASAGTFEALGMRVAAGRTFDRTTDGHDGALVVVVNDALARRYFPAGDAVGALLDLWGETRRVVGVVGGVRDHPADLETAPALWFPLAQMPRATVNVAVRSAGMDPASLTGAVAAAVHAVDPEVALADVRTLESRARGALAARRLALSLFEGFAVLALVLAAAGAYALLAYLVANRRKELAIRAALGATRVDLGRLVLGDGLRLALAAALACLVLAPIGGRLMHAFLFNVAPLDAVTLAGAPLLLLAVAALACLGPARSAARSDPARAMRED